MTNKKLYLRNEDTNLFLTGRIYPAIKSCVNNRYKIVLAFFAYYSFMLNSFILNSDYVGGDIWKIWIRDVNPAASILFALFITLNSVNYFSNALEQYKFEGIPIVWILKGKFKFSSIFVFVWRMKIEIIFWLISMHMIRYAFFKITELSQKVPS